MAVEMLTVTRDESNMPRVEVPAEVGLATQPGDVVATAGGEQRVLFVSEREHQWVNRVGTYLWLYVDLEPGLPTEEIETGWRSYRMHQIFRHDGRTVVALFHQREMRKVPGENYSSPWYRTTCRPATEREIAVLAEHEQRGERPYFGMDPTDPSLQDWTA